MKLTVAICTWNRATMLRKSLGAFVEMDVPPNLEWELIVVDNNSTDDTELVINSFASKLPIKYVFEEKQGKSHALNRAVSLASGDYIIWTDDDAKVTSAWLNAYAAAFQEWPEASFFGGAVIPWFETEPPSWLRRIVPSVQGAYALVDFGDEPIDLTRKKVPHGVNMAIKTSVQRQYEYDTNVGPRPNSQLRGEETALVRSMIQDGHRGKWTPSAIVRHHVPKERQTLKYLRAFYRGLGEFESARQPVEAKGHFRKPLWMWRKAIVSECEYRVKKMTTEPEVWANSLVRSSIAWGRLLGSESKLR
ncbi:MAG: glycosyltransferase family 2 protein [Acidobacteriota bacterium]|nr:glycosyltransferase family 2 protein [Acidobacteriota bacterium]